MYLRLYDFAVEATNLRFSGLLCYLTEREAVCLKDVQYQSTVAIVLLVWDCLEVRQL